MTSLPIAVKQLVGHERHRARSMFRRRFLSKLRTEGEVKVVQYAENLVADTFEHDITDTDVPV